MGGGDGRGRSVLRLLAAVLFVVLGVTGVHGAGSPAVPAGAILTEHASVGAALIQLTPSAGRAEERLIRAADQAEEIEGPQPSTVELPVAGTAPATHLPPAGVPGAAPMADRQHPPLTRDATDQQGRAPPA